MDLRKTLTELENDDWGTPSHDSYLTQRCHELRNKPLENFDNEDLRIMIGQNISLNHLLPIALINLEKDPLAEGMHYKGDLLCNVLRLDSNFYSNNPIFKMRVRNLIQKAAKEKVKLDEIDMETFEDALAEALEVFNA